MLSPDRQKIGYMHFMLKFWRFCICFICQINFCTTFVYYALFLTSLRDYDIGYCQVPNSHFIFMVCLFTEYCILINFFTPRALGGVGLYDISVRRVNIDDELTTDRPSAGPFTHFGTFQIKGKGKGTVSR